MLSPSANDQRHSKPIHYRGKGQSFGEVKKRIQGHVADKWLGQDLKPGLPVPQFLSTKLSGKQIVALFLSGGARTVRGCEGAWR